MTIVIRNLEKHEVFYFEVRSSAAELFWYGEVFVHAEIFFVHLEESSYEERSSVHRRGLLFIGEIFCSAERSSVLRKGLLICGKVFCSAERSSVLRRCLLFFGKLF